MRVAVAGFLQLRLAVDRLRQRDGIGGIVGHQLAELVDLAIAHLLHAADVAQHGARLQAAEGDDLRDAVGAIFLLHVVDDFVAPLLAEVDVEVGHRHALGIQEALEQQAEAQRIEIGDGERIGDQRARARAAPRSDGDVVRFGPLDEVGDDQEVAREFHLRDDLDLEGEAVPVFLFDLAGGEADLVEPRAQSLLGLALQFARLGGELGGRIGARRCCDELRQDRFTRCRPHMAAARDLQRVGDCLGEIGKQRAHGVLRFEMMSRGQLAPVVLGDIAPFGDADEGVVRLVVGGLAEIDLVGRDDRQIHAVGQIEQVRFDVSLRWRAVALQLDIEPVAEGRWRAASSARARARPVRRQAPYRWGRPARRSVQ